MDHLEPASVTVGAATGAHVRILAPAKVNFGLAVLGKRGDGYHEIRTIFQSVSLCDRIALRPARSGIRVECPALAGLGENNLAHRAASLFFAKTGVSGGLRIVLEKRIPAGGGLGGGSSDAAAVLLGCCRLFRRQPGLAALRDWAAALGSDVPFFLEGGAAIGSGRGEILERLPPLSPPAVALIQMPAAGLSTAAVYGHLRPTARYLAAGGAVAGGVPLTSRESGNQRSASPVAPRGAANRSSEGLTESARKFTILLAWWRKQDPRRLAKVLFNDLETPAFGLAPGLAAVKEAFSASGAEGALLCGSGSSVFGLFGSDGAADLARRRLRGRFPGRLIKVRFLPARRRWGVVKR